MATLEYDITHYQPILFACDGMGELTERVGGFFAGFDDETPERLAREAGVAGVTTS
jgi:phenylalanine-4-hydroxylase